MVRKGTGRCDGEVKWTFVGTTLGRANAVVVFVGVQTFKPPHSLLGGIIAETTWMPYYCFSDLSAQRSAQI